MNIDQQTAATGTVPTPQVGAATPTPPPETHQVAAQPPQNFALPTAPALHTRVAAEGAPQMQSPGSTTAPDSSPVVDSEVMSSVVQPPMAPPLGMNTSGNGMLPPVGSMPPQTGTSSLPPKKSFPLKAALALILVVLTLVGGGAAYYLSQTPQDLRQRAAENAYPATTPPATPPSGSSACLSGQFNCGSYSSDPAGCSSHAGQGCYYHRDSSSCKCGNGGGSNTTGATASCSGGKARICGGTNGATFCVLSCSQQGNYSGDSCNYGCNGSCTDISVGAGQCQDVGPGTSSCGRWQVDVHGAASCADSGCSSSGCGGGGSTPTPPASQTPAPVSISATVSISQPNCVQVAGKYQTGSAITFNGSATNTTNSRLFIAKLNAAGNGLDTTFNASCPIGTPSGNSGQFCMITEATAATTASWTPTQAGKYVIVVNGSAGSTSCSGNPTCTFNAGDGNLITPTTSCAPFVSCSNNDFKYFEVVSAVQCNPQPVVLQCGQRLTGAANESCASGLVQANTSIRGSYCSKPEYQTQCASMDVLANPASICCTAQTPKPGIACGVPLSCNDANPCQAGLVCNKAATAVAGTCSLPANAAACLAANPLTGNLQQICCTTPTAPPPTPGPMCLNIAAKKEDGTVISAGTTLKLGDKVRFTCGTVSGVSTYGFRVIEAGTKLPVETVAGTTSKVYTVTKPGSFVAQCTICPNGTCYPFTPTDP